MLTVAIFNMSHLQTVSARCAPRLDETIEQTERGIAPHQNENRESPKQTVTGSRLNLPVLIDDLVDGRRSPTAQAFMVRCVGRTARRRRRRPVAYDGHLGTGNTLAIEKSVCQLGRADARQRLVEKAQSDIADSRLIRLPMRWWRSLFERYRGRGISSVTATAHASKHRWRYSRGRVS